MSILDKDSMTEDHWSNNPHFKKDTSMRQDDDDIQDYVDTAKERMFAHTFHQVVRNQTLEEVAREFDKMKSLGDTAASFAVYVRNMKK
jgi:LysM repeat protein